MATRRRRMTRGGLIKTSVSLSAYQVEMLGRISQAQGISVFSAVVGQAVDEKLRSPAMQNLLRHEPESEPVAV
jgi:hypothetical protein